MIRLKAQAKMNNLKKKKFRPLKKRQKLEEATAKQEVFHQERLSKVLS
jgi:hypothetical protein